MKYLSAALVALSFAGCTITHKIEPSDKPIVVNMNINHEIKLKIEQENQDLLNLEQDFLEAKEKKSEG